MVLRLGLSLRAIPCPWIEASQVLLSSPFLRRDRAGGVSWVMYFLSSACKAGGLGGSLSPGQVGSGTTPAGQAPVKRVLLRAQLVSENAVLSCPYNR